MRHFIPAVVFVLHTHFALLHRSICGQMGGREATAEEHGIENGARGSARHARVVQPIPIASASYFCSEGSLDIFRPLRNSTSLAPQQNPARGAFGCRV